MASVKLDPAISRTVCAVVEGHRSEPGMGRELLSGIQGLDQAARLRQDAGSDAERAVELHEHAEAITSWRDGLPERQRRRLMHPLSVTRRWRASQRTATAGAHTGPTARRPASVGSFLCLHEGIAGG